MLLCRFNNDRLGLVENDVVFDVTEVLRELPSHRYPLPAYDPFIAALPQLLPLIKAAAASAVATPVDEAALLSPVANPGKIIGAPVNYLDHLAEAKATPDLNHGTSIEKIQRIGLFLKSNSSLVGPSQGVAIEHPDRRNDHEVELVAIVGKGGRNIAREHAFEHIAGYSIGLDMTVRGPEERSLRKSIDTYSVLGPWFVTADSMKDPSRADIWIDVNREPRQRANTSDLILGIAELIEFASSYYTLYPGDLIYTGTPAGVAPVEAGDTLTAGISGIGEMTVSVRAKDAPTVDIQSSS